MIKWHSQILLEMYRRAQLGGKVLPSKAYKRLILLELTQVSDKRSAEGSNLLGALSWHHEVRA